jgi:hypothetical protein
MPNIIGVPKMPGAMVMQRMPLRARSRAISKVMPAMPPSLAAYPVIVFRRSAKLSSLELVHQITP